MAKLDIRLLRRRSALWGRRLPGQLWAGTAPIRAELFSAERLEAHGRSLAEAHGRGVSRSGKPLKSRLADNEATLLEAYRDTVEALDQGVSITPAAEWLIDNFHLAEKQIREIRLDLPEGYYRQLPKIAAGHLAGYPRVFGIAWAFVAHTDSHFDSELLCRFLRAYQEVEPLAIGELWAVAITLRVVLVENLRRIAERIVVSRAARAEADTCADCLLGLGKAPPCDPSVVFRSYRNAALADAFVVQLCQRLRDHEAAAASVQGWLDTQLVRQGATTDELVRDEQQRQVAASVTVRNIVHSMRLISDVDWADLVERVSLVDDLLRAGSAFGDMDFATRNLYRNAVEELARGSQEDELEVARRALRLARDAAEAGGGERRGDPGYYLVGAGRAGLESVLGFRPPVRGWPGRIVRNWGVWAYVAAILGLAGVLMAPALGLAWSRAGPAVLVGLAALGAFPAMDAAIALVNRGVTGGFRARPLAALELKGGVPQMLRTIVVIPVLLRDAADVDENVEKLEIHHLSSPEGHLHFALLSDWPDASAETLPGDDALFRRAQKGIHELNRRHGPAPGGDRFLLFHRRRLWSDSEQCWMGWERKRGKLAELNRILRGAHETSFIAVDGQVIPSGVRYVLTLDADTKLPRDAVRRLIGKMAHPLNRPRFEPALGRVVEGYGILQPRITPALPADGQGSLFRRVTSSVGGIDPYAAAVSDVYQDLFGEGSFSGKGIYDVDAFEASLAGRVPEASLLSHDLFEGIFARAGLASDVEVVEDFPDRYDAALMRHHRWARGDWQLLPWILGLARRPPGEAGHLPAIGRWKMIDNLRRTLSPAAAVASLLAGWTLPGLAAVGWTAFVLACLAIPPFIPVAASLGVRRPGVPVRSRLHNLAGDLQLAITQTALSATLLADQTCAMADAIGRTLWRLFISHRRLLEWVPAAQAASRLKLDLPSFLRRMTPAAVLGLAACAWGLAAGDSGMLLAIPVGALWALSPLIAYGASLPPRETGQRRLADADAHRLREIARRTWGYFEEFVTPADNMLPPDNFQEDPTALARRTSPTNIGLYLLSAAAARDFGWIGTHDAVARLEATLATLHRMERLRGHFYNWYDTATLAPLEPRYISSVDSGNLAGHLLALANAAEEWISTPLAAEDRLRGVLDSLRLLQEGAAERRSGRNPDNANWRRLEGAVERLTSQIATALRGAVATASWAPLATSARGLIDACEAVAIEISGDTQDGLVRWAKAVELAIESHARDTGLHEQFVSRLETLAADARRMAMEMDFAFLLDPDRMLLSIGYRAADGQLDPTCYDLLGSEAQLASFFAIAKGDVPTKHWFRLSHAVTPVASGAALISWSGSMFEYLMPSLVLRAPPGSVLAQTNRLVVRRQMEYAAGLRIPWGISESAYNARDLELTYQYLSFGVPSLGLKRGLADHIVVAPYATALAAMVDPAAAVRNLAALDRLGACGRYGYYEALDFTPARVPEGERFALVRAFMAHHQGMTITAIADAVCDGAMRRRFHAEPMVQATELLLEERMPREVVISQPWVARTGAQGRPRELDAPGGRRIASPHAAAPAVQLLSNGTYSVMLTAAGSGYSRWRDLAVTRWREDATADPWGAYVYLRDVQSGAVWSAGWQPIGGEPDTYEALFNEDRCEISRRDGSLHSTFETLVSAEDDGEVRRVSISNRGFTVREIEVTSYAEVVLAPAAADAAHPAFSNLFIETEHLPSMGALLATRRRRSPTDPEVWAAHLAVVEGERIGAMEFDTDRAQVLGRGRDARRAQRIVEGGSLGGSVGYVLDPVFALRRRVRLAPGATARVSFWTLVADSRKAILDLIDKHHDAAAFERAANLAWTQTLVQLHHLGVSRSEAGLFQRLAGHIVYLGSALRPPMTILRQGQGGQPGLWRMGVSGDLPLVVVRIGEVGELAFARQLVKAGEYLRSKQLLFDLVLLNERGASYVQDLQVALESLVRAGQSHAAFSEHSPPGRTIVLRADLIAPESRDLLLSVARVVLDGQAGSLGEQLDRVVDRAVGPPPSRRRNAPSTFAAAAEPAEIEFANGVGGFTSDGREYVTLIQPGQQTPAPWINVIANPTFGFQVSADGAGCTWRGNSREHLLTPWSNDPVTDPTGEAIYLRDEETGEIWSPTPAPLREEAASYVCHHGRGYSRFEHTSRGVAVDLAQFVPLDAPVKVTRLRLRNLSGRSRRLSVTSYAEWVLGQSRAAVAAFTSTSFDSEASAIFARNAWNPGFNPSVAFSALGRAPGGWTADRREFLGRNGSLAAPAALCASAPLSRTAGPGLDPCAVLQETVELGPNASCDVLVLLGETDTEEEARALIAKWRATDPDAALAGVMRAWEAVTGGVQVRTPDRTMDLMLNGWLLYQTLASRIWARAGFYQASGAYGFRDQLQDGMALAAVRPDLTREHLLRAAARQFAEGDVQHWWLPHSGQGVRTRISDDRLWLAYATAHYIDTTGDAGVLDAMAPFIAGPALEGGEAEQFFMPSAEGEPGSLYEHCARALDASLDLGGHGLPLFGAGDWNDGMNRVGARGRGESVWLGWFLHAAMSAFLPFAEERDDKRRVAAWRAHLAALAASLERTAWDGGWYRRGWFDDGAPLGSAANEECRIDSIAQSWAVISGVARESRAREAMAAVERQLVRKDDQLALLFTPPFDRTPMDPGYIKAYPPGVRENGGQYTHAAAWAVIALAMLGKGDKAHELFALLNPINHARSRAAAHRYRVEPYVVAADVYASGAHEGRGGWTWYTGSAAWLQRAGVEYILGLRRQAGGLQIDPCIPPEWPRFEATIRHGTARYEILVENPERLSRGVASVELDGAAVEGWAPWIPLVDDGGEHRVVVRLGATTAALPARRPKAARS